MPAKVWRENEFEWQCTKEYLYELKSRHVWNARGPLTDDLFSVVRAVRSATSSCDLIHMTSHETKEVCRAAVARQVAWVRLMGPLNLRKSSLSCSYPSGAGRRFYKVMRFLRTRWCWIKLCESKLFFFKLFFLPVVSLLRLSDAIIVVINMVITLLCTYLFGLCLNNLIKTMIVCLFSLGVKVELEALTVNSSRYFVPRTPKMISQ